MLAIGISALSGSVADAASSGSIVSLNKSSDPVWVTYYNVTKNQLGAACVSVGQRHTETLDWSDVVSSLGGVYLRFEYKQNYADGRYSGAVRAGVRASSDRVVIGAAHHGFYRHRIRKV
jgi:hypothetical protein